MAQFFGQRMPNRTEKQSSLGSGVIVEANGTVITNNHVVDGADDIKIALSDGREFPCKVVLKDDRVDLAVLKIQSKNESFPVLPLGNSDGIEVGDLVLAIGNPFGVGQTVTSGIVSALAVVPQVEGHVETRQGQALDHFLQVIELGLFRLEELARAFRTVTIRRFRLTLKS